jgi:dGTPase
MNWNQLLSAKRTGQESRPNELHDRTQFQRDFDRLIFSSPFRRLQDKTQVFPLPGSTFVHNRLTHSLEVASVGRSMGNNVSRMLATEHGVTIDLVHEIGSVVAAACLAHDLGNPPFGHSGEKAISNFFIHGDGQKYQSQVSKEQWLDLINFEGNANAFRLLTHQFNGRRAGGFAMTYTTVASIVKYPCHSGYTQLKKYGYFNSEAEAFQHIAIELGLLQTDSGVYVRHPLVYLVEAADDICYQFMDIEDAHKLRILSTDETKKLFLAFFNQADELHEIERIHKVFDEVSDVNEQIAFLRAKVIGKLVNHCTQIFMANQNALLNGEFQQSLVDWLPETENQAMKNCTDLAIKRIYKHPSVVEVEIAGFKILNSLLSEFSDAVLLPDKAYSKLLLPFIPLQYKIDESDSVYHKLQSVIDFVSGMTDVYALELFRKINGLGLSDKGFR